MIDAAGISTTISNRFAQPQIVDNTKNSMVCVLSEIVSFAPLP